MIPKMRRLFSILVSVHGIVAVANEPVQIIDGITAIVENELILNSDVKNLEKEIAQGVADENLFLGKTPQEMISDTKNRVQYLIYDRIIVSAIGKAKLNVTSESISEEVRAIARQNRISEDDLYKALASQGITPSSYQNSIRNRIERNALKQQEILGRLRLSDEDILSECFRRNPQLSRDHRETVLSHIFFDPRKGGWEDAQERATKVLGRLKRGESFDLLAEQNSQDPRFTANALLGEFKSGEMTKEFELAVGGLSVGEFSEVVRSKNGVHILRVNSRQDVQPPLCEKEKEKIRGNLLEAAFEKQFKLWLEIKESESFIRINEA